MATPNVRCVDPDVSSLECDLLAVPAYKDRELGPGAELVDEAVGGGLREFLEELGFSGDRGETATVPTPGRAFRTAMVVGLGPREDVGVQTLRQAAAVVARKAKKSQRLATTLALAGPDGASALATAAVAEGAILGAYEFLAYKTQATPSELADVAVASADPSGLEPAVALARAVCFARDLVNEPAGGKPPAEIARRVSDRAAQAGVACEVWGQGRIEAEKLGGLLGVAQGSDHEPRLVRLEYVPEGEPAGTVALVGKGITFDSGGLSIKTAEGMENMKTDMSGAAAVAATMTVLPALGCPARVVAYALFTENMSGGKAMKPGDVLRFRNGKTAEVLNTDAEGRLILADGLSLACESNPDAVIDVATLTGACQVALGLRIAGLFSTDDGLAGALEAAAEASGERVWRLPLPPDYKEMIESDVADVKNTGGRMGGAITAALFLKEFVTEGTPWAHLDIAGPARSDAETYEISKGGTGMGVRTLASYLADWSRPQPTAVARPGDCVIM